MATKTGLTPAEIRTSHLYGVVLKASGEADDFLDRDIERKIRAAEDFWARNTQIVFGTKKIASQAAARNLVKGTDYDIEEEAYTYPPDFFYKDQWGYLQLRQKPVQSVERVSFAFPHPGSSVFDLPLSWVRLDKKYGQINLIPTSGPTILMALNSFILSTVGGGFSLPKSVLVDYTVGIDEGEMEADFADVLEGIALRTTLSLLPQLGVARSNGLSSGSLSMDGLSESQGFQGKFGAYSGMIEAAIVQEKELRENFIDQTKGIQLMVM